MSRTRIVVLATLALAVAVAAPLVVWSGTGGYFWPRWVWFGLGALVVGVLLARWIARVPTGRRRWLTAGGALLVFLTPVEITAWLLSGRGFFWPVYSLLSLSVLFGALVWTVSRSDDPAERRLVARVDSLTRTRRGAVDSQAAELRRIERDLHDGAQARIVSAALNIGIAQSLLTTDPARAAQVLEEARSAAVGAVEDLRGVMHGIYPAVLADRGLGGAVRALAYDLPVEIEVDGDPPTELPAATETALYFSVAECLANTVKHSGAGRGWVVFDGIDGALRVEVGDDGTGGAASRPGGGLAGIAQRLDAFDATLLVDSPRGGPTRITIELPGSES